MALVQSIFFHLIYYPVYNRIYFAIKARWIECGGNATPNDIVFFKIVQVGFVQIVFIGYVPAGVVYHIHAPTSHGCKTRHTPLVQHHITAPYAILQKQAIISHHHTGGHYPKICSGYPG
jgi:hypothetical protein